MIPVTARPVEITDPDLLNLHNQYETDYLEAKKQAEAFLPELERSIGNIADLAERVFTRVKAYQEETIVVPSKSKLDQERDGFLKEYRECKIIHQKAVFVAGNILGTIRKIIPVQRNWSQEKTLLEKSPELQEQIKWSEKICLAYVKELEQTYAKVASLKDRLFLSIKSTTLAYDLKRFCNIVANKGKPLSWLNRSIYYVYPHLVPVILRSAFPLLPRF